MRNPFNERIGTARAHIVAFLPLVLLALILAGCATVPPVTACAVATDVQFQDRPVFVSVPADLTDPPKVAFEPGSDCAILMATAPDSIGAAICRGQLDNQRANLCEGKLRGVRSIEGTAVE